jgi:hypothetical protein
VLRTDRQPEQLDVVCFDENLPRHAASRACPVTGLARPSGPG